MGNDRSLYIEALKRAFMLRHTPPEAEAVIGAEMAAIEAAAGHEPKLPQYTPSGRVVLHTTYGQQVLREATGRTRGQIIEATGLVKWQVARVLIEARDRGMVTFKQKVPGMGKAIYTLTALGREFLEDNDG